MSVRKFICHSYTAISEAITLGWLPGARYTNLRDVKRFDRLGFLDIEWQNYDFNKHLQATKDTLPLLTVAQDIVDASDLSRVLDEAFALSQWAEKVIIVPKDPRLKELLADIPSQFLLGYSVPFAI